MTVQRDHEFGPDGQPKKWNERTERTLFDLDTIVFRGAARSVVVRRLDSSNWSNLTSEEIRRIDQMNSLCEQMKYEPLFTYEGSDVVTVDADIEALLREVRATHSW